MRLLRLVGCALTSLLLTTLSSGFPPQIKNAELVDFQRSVRPILSDKCFQCHGPDSETRMAGLRLDTREGIFAQRDNGTPIVIGKPQSSLLYQRITTTEPARRMPPIHSKKELTEEQIQTLKDWIEQGASWDQHWSFQALKRPELPLTRGMEWVRNPIDRFVLARLESEGLEPASEADRHTLIRRLSLDLTGLPPTPEQIEAFLNDPAENAYENLIHKLLDLQSWGEHRSRTWLEAARYADTHGLHHDAYREMWPYRDWVINAFNQNMPFDRFTIEQLAGDLLESPTLEQNIATGFHRCNVTTNEGVISEEVEAIYAKDRADTTGTVWLGLTVGCATCHDHKFDPIPTKDFYSMTAFFRNINQQVMDGDTPDTPPIIVVPSMEDRREWNELNREQREVGRQMKEISSSDEEFEAWFASAGAPSLRSPLKKPSEVLSLSVDHGIDAHLNGRRVKVKLLEGVSLGPGPEGDRGALHFSGKAWSELPDTGYLDAKRPFSIATWFYRPESEEQSFALASQFDPRGKGRGWNLSLTARRPNFAMVGDDGKKINIQAGLLQESETGVWNHLTVTYDGSGERAGLNLYLNGNVVPTQGSDYFEKLKGDIRTGQPILLGKQVNVVGENEMGRADKLFLSGGAMADFRIFNRVIAVEEARLIWLEPALQRAWKKESADLTREEREILQLYYLNRKNEGYRELVGRLRELKLKMRELRRRGGITHVMKERSDSQPFAHVLYRGMYDQPRERVEANVPVALPPMPASFPRNRLGLAKWLVDESNPLTARVTVNRFWQEIFGTGIVKTADDFGSQGEPPSHPKLLDWLALEFRDSGWNVKDFFKLIVSSATYRQSATTTKKKLAKDAGNRLLARGPRFRMDGEMVRDYGLAASGLLVSKIGGPSVKPYQPDGIWKTVTLLASKTRFYRQDHGEKLYRRSLYTFWKRAAPPASMEIFNAPTREYCIVRRDRTNTPLQALVTMNDPQFIEAARHLAQGALREAEGNFNSQLDYMSLRLTARRFGKDERKVSWNVYKDLLAYYQKNTKDAEKLLAIGESKRDLTFPEAESAALTMLANQIMNLDEVLNK